MSPATLASAPPARRSTWQRIGRARRSLAPLARPHRGLFLQGSLATVGVVACRLAFPWPMRAVLESTVNAGHRAGPVLQWVPGGGDPLVWLIGAFVAIILLWGLTEHLQRLAFARYAGGVAREARAAALQAIADGSRAGETTDLVDDARTDARRLKSSLRSVLVNTTRNGLFFVAATVIIAVIDLRIGLVFLAGGVVSVGVALVGARRAAKLSRRLRAREPAVTETVEALDDRESANKLGLQSRGAPSGKVVRAEGWTTMAIHAVLAVSTSIILILAVHAARAGTLSPGGAFTILIYTLYMHNKTVSLGRRTVSMGRLLTSAERLARLIDPGKKARREAREAAAAG